MVAGIDGLVRIQDQDPVTAAVPQAFVPSCRKVVTPGKGVNPCAKRLGDGHGIVRGSGVHHHHLVHQFPDRGQAVSQVTGLVLDDHGQGKGWHNWMIRLPGGP